MLQWRAQAGTGAARTALRTGIRWAGAVTLAGVGCGRQLQLPFGARTGQQAMRASQHSADGAAAAAATAHRSIPAWGGTGLDCSPAGSRACLQPFSSVPALRTHSYAACSHGWSDRATLMPKAPLPRGPQSSALWRHRQLGITAAQRSSRRAHSCAHLLPPEASALWIFPCTASCRAAGLQRECASSPQICKPLLAAAPPSQARLCGRWILTQSTLTLCLLDTQMHPVCQQPSHTGQKYDGKSRAALGAATSGAGGAQGGPAVAA